MPSVPVTNRNSVEVRPLDRNRLRYDAPRNFVGPAVQGFGQALGQVAEDIDRIDAIHDETGAKKLDNDGIGGIREIVWTGDDAYYRKQGFDAVNAQAATEAALKELRDKLASQARTPRERQMFEQVFDRRVAQEMEGVARHAIVEGDREWDRQSVARGVNAATEAITYGDDPERREVAVQTGLGEIRMRADKQGWSPDVLRFEELKYRSGVWRGIADAKMREAPEEAADLVEQHKDEMLPTDYQAVKDSVYPRILERRGELLADLALGVAGDPAEEPSPSNGRVGPVTDAKTIVETMFPGARVTDWRRDPNSSLGRANPNSWHNRSGAAVDVAPIPGVSFDQYVGKFRRAGYQVIEAIDEVKHPSAHATGPHWHVVLGNRGSPQPSQFAPRREDLEGAYRWIDQNDNLSFDEKQAARQAIEHRVSRNDALVRRQEQDAHDQAADLVFQLGDGFTSMSQLPPDLQRRLSSDDRLSFSGLAKRNAAPEPPKTDYVFYQRLSDTYASDRAAFMQISPVDARRHLSDGDFEKYMEWRRDAISGKGDRTPKQVSHDRILKVADDALTAEGLSTVNRKGEEREDVARRRGLFVKQMADRVREWQAVHGVDKEPSDDDLLRMAGNLLLNAGDSGANVFEATPEQIAKGISANDRARIIEALRLKGVAVTDQSIAQAYLRWGTFARAERAR